MDLVVGAIEDILLIDFVVGFDLVDVDFVDVVVVVVVVAVVLVNTTGEGWKRGIVVANHRQERHLFQPVAGRV